MIFIDSNIPMYLIGQEHPHKRDVVVILERLVTEKRRLVTNTEVLQEILHRYTAIHRKQDIQIAFDALYGFVDQVYDITEADVLAAKSLVVAYESLSARDAIHAAQMKSLKIRTLFSFDRGFDILPDLQRIS